MPLRGRVGRHIHDGGRQCQNWPDDQKAIISLLNRIPVAAGGAAGNLSKPVVSGICSDEFYRGITTFEDKHFPGEHKGYVDPAGAMLKRMEDLAAAAARVDFVTPVAFLGPPTGPTKVISGQTLAGMTQNDVFFVGIAGDSNNVVKTVSADVPNAVTIEDAGVTGSGIRWFRLSRARVNNATIQAKDAKGTVVSSFLLDIVLVPKASGPTDFSVDPADPKRPNTINLSVRTPKDDADYVDTRMTDVGYEIYLHNGFQLYCTGMKMPVDVPDAVVDLNPDKFEPIDAKVYDTLAQANEAIRRAPAKPKGVVPFAYYRGAGGAVIAPTVFSTATTPRIIATLWEARRLYTDYVQHELAGLAIGLIEGKVFSAVLGRARRAFTGDPKPPRGAPLPPPNPKGRIVPGGEEAVGAGPSRRISPVDRGRGARPYYAKDPKARLGRGGWTFNPKVDANVRTHDEAVAEAFRRTGVPQNEFVPTQVAKTANGKTITVEWTVKTGPNRGAQVNIDDPRIVPTREGPQAPHVGYRTPGGEVRGHVFPQEGVLASRSRSAWPR